MPDYSALTDRELMEALLNRLDIIAGASIIIISAAAVIVTIYIIYRFILNFI